MVYIKSFKNQSWLFPPSIKEMITEDHICFLVEEIINKLDFSEFDIKYAGPGHPAYHPRILVKILIQAMLDRIRSSRAMARNVRENVVFMFLAEKLTPDFRTISDFRKDNGNLIKDVFKITISTAKELGAVGLEQLSIDGSKLKASASNNSVVTKEELDIIEKYVNNELEEGIELDNIEDEQFKDCRGYGQLKKSSKKKVKFVVTKYLKQMKKSKNKYKQSSKIKNIIKKARSEVNTKQLIKVSLTDPESRFMKNKKGRIELSYNPQITVDHRNGIIVANDICQSSNDVNQLKPQIKLVEENCGRLKEGTKISIDNGYYSGKNINYLDGKELNGYIPDRYETIEAKGKKIKINKFDKINFKYDEKNDEYICPEGYRLKFSYQTYDKTKKRDIKVYKGINCKECPTNSICTKMKNKVRKLKVSLFEKEKKEMFEKLKTKKAKEIYKKRREVVEPVIGNIKENLRFRNLLTRGLNSIKSEFNLACTAHNLRKIWKLSQNKRNLQTQSITNSSIVFYL